MEYPFHIELDISQDDFIRAEILEMGADTQIDRREDLISFIVQSFLALAVGVILFITYRKGNAEGWTLFLPFLFEAFFRLNFRFNYFSNYKREFRYGVNHLLENSADHTFFKPEKGFAEFLGKLEADDLKSEYLLPTIIGNLLKEGKVRVKVLESRDKWFGVTYKEDKEGVVAAIRDLIDKGEY